MANKKKNDKKKEKPANKTTPEEFEANVDDDGYCITVEDGEMSRPDSGGPCDDGRG